MTLFPLRVRGAVAQRRGKTLVGPVDLDLDGKGVTVLIGPNGSGKTSLLTLLHGTLRLHAGSIRWACPVAEARLAQAFVFQQPVMLRRSVRDNILYPLRLRGIGRAGAMARAMDLAARMQLDHVPDRPAVTLSPGERQKLALARALAPWPALLFLDEPCAALDGPATRSVEAVLKQTSDTGTSLILSTHDLGQARRLATRVIFLLRGRVHETGPAADFFTRPRTREAAAFLRGDIVE